MSGRIEVADPEPAGGGREDAVTRTARAALRRHAASPLTRTLPFWERLVREVLRAADGLGGDGRDPASPDEVAKAAAPALSGSPVTSSPSLWRGIVATILTEHRSPSGLGEPIPSHLPGIGRPRAGARRPGQ